MAVDGKTISQIGRGLMILVGINRGELHMTGARNGRGDEGGTGWGGTW